VVSWLCVGVVGLLSFQAWPCTYTYLLASVGRLFCGVGGGVVCAVGVVGWSLVENCTVDASIFVVKLSRANGGCLGTRSR
jgi:hypothetical protein